MSKWPIYVVTLIFVVFAGIFLVEFINLSSSESEGEAAPVLDEDTYMEIVVPLLEDADPANGELLVQEYACVGCHMANANARLAPPFTQVAAVAGERRPPLQPEAYIYESILYPGAYEVEGYMNNMPRNYGTLVSDDELGDIIAYLLTLEENE